MGDPSKTRLRRSRMAASLAQLLTYGFFTAVMILPLDTLWHRAPSRIWSHGCWAQ